MLTSNDEPISPQLRRRMDKAAVLRMVAAMLDGANLKFRQLKNELVITNPSAPENGRVRIEYVTGHMSWQREMWDFFGPVQGFETEDDDESYVGADAILSILRDGKPPERRIALAEEDPTHAE